MQKHRWGDKPRGITLDTLLELPQDVSYHQFKLVATKTQAHDPLGDPGWNKVMIGLADYGRPDLVNFVFRWVKESGQFEIGLPMYCSAMSALERGGQWDNALIVAEDVQHSRLDLDLLYYTTAMSACSGGGCWERALNYWQAIQETNLEANTVAYTSLIGTCVLGGKPRHAFRMIKEMVAASVALDAITYDWAIRGCDQLCKYEKILQLDADMKARRIKPKPSTLELVHKASSELRR